MPELNIEKVLSDELGAMHMEILKLRVALETANAEIKLRDKTIMLREETIQDLRGQIAMNLERINGVSRSDEDGDARHGLKH